MNIPKQLQCPPFRFCRIKEGTKAGIGLGWNSYNSMSYDNPVLQKHIVDGGSVGIITGFGKLIVLDFDDMDFYKNIKHKLPETFIVKSGIKKMPHLYYFLQGEQFKTIHIDRCYESNCKYNEFGICQRSTRCDKIKRVADVLTNHSMALIPPSSINGNSYTV